MQEVTTTAVTFPSMSHDAYSPLVHFFFGIYRCDELLVNWPVYSDN
jgi:hypothetical protein